MHVHAGAERCRDSDRRRRHDCGAASSG
jgi:hypothetical protein